MNVAATWAMDMAFHVEPAAAVVIMAAVNVVNVSVIDNDLSRRVPSPAPEVMAAAGTVDMIHLIPTTIVPAVPALDGAYMGAFDDDHTPSRPARNNAVMIRPVRVNDAPADSH
jgi:hypothetical protein